MFWSPIHATTVVCAHSYGACHALVNTGQQALKSELLHRQPNRLGCSVLGYNDTYRRLHPFLCQWRAQRLAVPLNASPTTAPPRVFVVAVDIRRAFDSIQVPRLLRLLGALDDSDKGPSEGPSLPHTMPGPSQPPSPTPMLKPPGYMVVKYTQAVPHFTSVKCISRSHAMRLTDTFDGFPSLAQQRSASSSACVYVDQVLYSRGETAALVKLLRDHLQHALLQVDGQWFQQNTGIPQVPNVVAHGGTVLYMQVLRCWIEKHDS